MSEYASVHADRLERWLGAEEVDRISKSMMGHNGGPRWYGKPIAVANVPGRVFATKEGDFIGKINGGQFGNSVDYFMDRLKFKYKKWERRQNRQFGAGFSSLSDLIAEASAGKRREFKIQKTGITGVTGATSSLWTAAGYPAAGGAAAAAPDGTVFDDATTGAHPFTNPTGGDTQHFVAGNVSSSIGGQSLLLYDRLFGVTKTMSSTATEAVTGVPTRYTSTTGGAPDSAEGNFLMIECRTTLSATGHNWTTCLYTDQSGNASSTLPSVTGNSANIASRLDHPVNTWFCPLAVGDTGILELDQMQCSASVTGAINFVIGHPIAWMPVPIANLICVTDGINSAFNLERIFDDACLALLEVTKPSTSAALYTGSFTTVSG